MRVLIAGAGYVGMALARRLLGDHDVYVLRRSPDADPTAGLRTVTADLTAPDSLAGLPRMDAIVVTVSADERTPDAYERAYLTTVVQLRSQLEVEAIRPNRWIFTSSTAVYGDSGGDWVDEDSSMEPSGFAGRTLLRAEAAFLAAPWASIVVRLGGIYGPGRTRLLEQVALGEATIPTQPTFTNRIHRDDAAGILDHLLQLPDPDPVYLGVDTDPAERGEVLRWLADKLGAPPPATTAESTTRGNKRASSARLSRSGYRFLYPTYRDGYAALISARETGDDA
jgi:nucleoside-diphosphate-sugar epimerase